MHNTQNKTFAVDSDTGMQDFGASIGMALPKKALIFLNGTLGAGKTTLVKGLIKSLGYNGNVKSPTYTLVEPYPLAEHLVYHFDLYRLGHFEELEYIGMGDYLSAEAICIIEWPEKGDGLLPAADLICNIKINGLTRFIEVVAISQVGEKILQQL